MLKTIDEIANILGSNNAEKIRKAMTKAIIENIQESIEQEWFIAPSGIEKYLEEECEKVIKKLVKEYKPRIEEAYRQKFEEIIEDMMAEVGK